MIVVENALVIDGTGARGYVSDVAFTAKGIEHIGHLERLDAQERIDGRGLALTPGFIDLHTHSDVTVLMDPRTVSQSLQGVTAQVVGNCGFSAAPLKEPSHLSGQVLGPSPLDREADWRDFGSYRELLETTAPNTHVVPLVGHAALRSSILEDPRQAANEEQVRCLAQALAVAIEQGARGLSFGLEYSPGRLASPEELGALCEVAARFDVVVTVHVRNRDRHFRRAIEEVLELAMRTGARIHLSHIAPKFGADANALEWLLSRLEKDGRRVGIDEIPYLWGTTKMLAALPPELTTGDVDAIRRELKRPDAAERLSHHRNCMWQMVPEGRWDLVKLAYAPGSERFTGETMDIIARRKEIRPAEAVISILLDAGESVHEVLWLGRIKEEVDLRELFRQRICFPCSDGINLAPDGPLSEVRWSEACYGWIARAFGLLRQSGLTVEETVHRLTGGPAALLGWKRRGRIAEGAPADLALLNLESASEEASGAVRQAWISGHPVLAEGTVTRTASGRVV